jgi:uncharacterized protein YcbK (DUF882 family)
MPLPVRSVVTLALVLVSSTAAAASHAPARSHKKQARAAPAAKLRECVKAPVEIVAGSESATFSLAKCDGAAAAGGVHQLSNLAKAPGVHKLDARLVERLELAVDHFRKGVESARVVLVSGYRPRAAGSYHSTGRALDFRIDGVENEALVGFCKTLPDTGCGYYPNSGFVHIDVREPNTGHVTWTDISRPGEPPHYVTAENRATQAPAEAPRTSTLPALPGSGPDAKGDDAKPANKDERIHTL